MDLRISFPGHLVAKLLPFLYSFFISWAQGLTESLNRPVFSVLIAVSGLLESLLVPNLRLDGLFSIATCLLNCFFRLIYQLI